MKLVLEFEKQNWWDEGPDTIYKVVEVKGLTRAERKKKPRKVLEILKEVKETLFDNGRIKVNTENSIKFY